MPDLEHFLYSWDIPCMECRAYPCIKNRTTPMARLEQVTFPVFTSSYPPQAWAAFAPAVEPEVEYIKRFLTADKTPAWTLCKLHQIIPV